MTDDLGFWIFMAVVTLATSTVSGVLGMVGGLLLLAALLLRLEPTVAIPVHGIVQLASNVSRGWFLRKHIRARAVVPFALPLLPAGALGLSLLGRLDPGLGKALIGAFVLVVTWLPERRTAPLVTKPDPDPPLSARTDARLLFGGALVGFFSTLVGATGPLIAPFIVGLKLSPQGMVGTMAACQVFQHATKVLVFGLSGFDVGRQLGPALALSVCAMLGSALGTRFLDRVDRALFERIVKIVLTLLSIELLAEGARTLVVPSPPGVRSAPRGSHAVCCGARMSAREAGWHPRGYKRTTRRTCASGAAAAPSDRVCHQRIVQHEVGRRGGRCLASGNKDGLSDASEQHKAESTSVEPEREAEP